VIATRDSTVAARTEAVWALVADPRLLVRWWPRTERVEGFRENAWTTVMRSDRGRVVRADWRLDVNDPPHRRAWTQVVAGTPFEKVISERRVEVRLDPVAGGTRVTLELRQRSRKLGRLGDLVLRGPAGRELDAALARLAGAIEE
jgi:uncharacterized protein YndB with AHSA1/START domain